MPAHTRLHPQPPVCDPVDDDPLFHPPPRRPWLDQAACVDVALSVFFSDDGWDLLEALAICRGCPVRQQCLEYALATRERHGVWGGKTPEQRRLLLQADPYAPHTGNGDRMSEEAS